MIKRLVITLGLAFLFLTSCAVSTQLLHTRSNWLFKNKVGEVSIYFPVLVIVTRDNGEFDAGIVNHFDLSLVAQQFPEHTFLIPEGKENEVNSRLGSLKLMPRRGEEPTDTGHGSVSVEVQALNRQRLVVHDTSTPTWENTGWYEVNGKAIFPQYHRYYSRERSIVTVLMVTIPANIAGWGVGTFLWNRRRRKLAR